MSNDKKPMNWAVVLYGVFHMSVLWGASYLFVNTAGKMVGIEWGEWKWPEFTLLCVANMVWCYWFNKVFMHLMNRFFDRANKKLDG